MLRMKGILYISYDGMLEPLGQSQVLAYLKPLGASYRIYLISFEKAADWSDRPSREELRREIAAAGIAWLPLRYHKRPTVLATSWDIARGIVLGIRSVWRYRLCVVHARSYVPSAMALGIKFVTGIRYLFDMRGFWADERVDGNLWAREGSMYRLAKWCEKRFLLRADHVVSLTNAAVVELRRFAYLKGRMPSFTVIPTCADLRIFRPCVVEGRDATFVLGYVGSVGTWYLFPEVAECFAELLRLMPNARLLILNKGDHVYIRKALTIAGIPEHAVELKAVNYGEVAAEIARMDAGIFFIKPVFSKQASAPTKLAEFLGCGIPCLTNVGVGDVAQILESENVGVAVATFDRTTLSRGLSSILQLAADPQVKVRCVATAEKYFSLDAGVKSYAAIYKNLTTLK